MSTETRQKLNTAQRMRVLALMARGDTYAQIRAHLQSQYDITISDNSLSDIKKRHGDTLAEMTRTMVEHEAIEAEDLLKKTRRMIGRKLSQAEQDANKLAKLDEQYREGDITKSQYDLKRAGLLGLSINQLVAVSKEMHNQVMKDIPPGLPPGASATGAIGGGNPAITEAIVAAIKNGDTVELQRLVFKRGGVDAQPIAVS